MMEALDQHFLANHYGWMSAARLLVGSKSPTDAGAGPGRAWFRGDRAGISYSMPGEPHSANSYAHRVSLAAIQAHMAAQPASRVVELRDAMRDHSAEYRRWWDAMTAIHPHWYSSPDVEVRTALQAEETTHRTVADRMMTRIHAAVLAVLPLHDHSSREPANLIEWAEALSISDSEPRPDNPAEQALRLRRDGLSR